MTLTEAEYRKALAYIKHLQATKKTWHATTYNCNAFAADIARHIGLDAPNPNMYLPQTFISRMAELNPRRQAEQPVCSQFLGLQQAPQRKRSRSGGHRLSGPRSRRRSSASSKAASLSSEMKRPASLRAFLHF